MPSLKDQYSKLQSVNNKGAALTLPTLQKAESVKPVIIAQVQSSAPEPTQAPPVVPDSSSSSKQELFHRGLTEMFDPHSGKTEASSKDPPRSISLLDAVALWMQRHPEGSLRDFLTSKIPADFPTVESRVSRQRGFFGTSFFPTYLLGQETAKGSGLKSALLTTKKKHNNKTSNYPICMVAQPDLAAETSEKLGKLRSNFLGSEFVVYSTGENPTKVGIEGGEIRRELLALTYEGTQKKAPRELRATIPRETPKVPGKVLREATERDDTVMHLRNRKPRWNERIQAYVLNFSKRVNEASVKNFQLVDESDNVVLQFGKVSKDDFSLDFKYPFSPMEAFGVALSAFDFKWYCE